MVSITPPLVGCDEIKGQEKRQSVWGNLREKGAFYDVVHCAVCFVIVFQELNNTLCAENGRQRFVFPGKAQSHQAVPFLKKKRRNHNSVRI